MKNWIKFISFILITITVIAGLDAFIFVNREEITTYTQFFKEENNSIDVVFVGNSTVRQGINPNIVWQEYGITSYNLTSTPTHPEVIILAIDDIVELQNPDLIFIDITGFSYQLESEQESFVKKYYNSLPESKRKDEIREMYSYLEEKEEPELFEHHNDFRKSQYYNLVDPNTYLKGYAPKWHVAPLKESEFQLDNTVMEIHEDGRNYMKRLLDTCAKYPEVQFAFGRLPRVLMKYTLPETYKLRSIVPMIEEYGYEYYELENYYDEIGLVASEDFDDEVHLNYWGTEKFTRFLIEFLDEKYEINSTIHSESVKKNFDKSFEKYQKKVEKKANRKKPNKKKS